MSFYRIPQLIQSLLKAYDGSINRLHGQFYDVGKCRINRPKLTKLCNDKEGHVPLNKAELLAIERLVVHWKSQGRTDRGLISLSEAPVFLQAGVMEAIETSRKPVLFVLGTRPAESDGRTVQDIRSWDCRGMAEVLNAMGGLHDVRVQFADCAPTQNHDELQERTWFTRAHEANNSIISIGAAHACAATEWMLSDIFGLQPFAHGSLKSGLPFYFVWSPRIAERFPSSTNLAPNDIPKMKSALADKIARNAAWGIMIREKPYWVFKDRKELQLIPGIFAAQGQPNGQVYVAICGITGTATFAVAKLLNEVKEELPFRARRERPGRVLWGAVKVWATLASEDVEVADSSDIPAPTWLVDPEIWPK